MTRYCVAVALSSVLVLVGCKPASEEAVEKPDAALDKGEAAAPAPTETAIPEDLDLVILNGRVMDPESKLDAVSAMSASRAARSSPSQSRPSRGSEDHRC